MKFNKLRYPILERNKVIYISFMGMVILFIISYALYLMEKDAIAQSALITTEVPELAEPQVEYTTKLQAVDAIKPERSTNAPSLYEEALIDSTGQYQIDLKERERRRIVDSIYREGRIDYTKGSYRVNRSAGSRKYSRTTAGQKPISSKAPIDLGKRHAAFFSAGKVQTARLEVLDTHLVLPAAVHGEQTVTKDNRIELRLTQEVIIQNRVFPRNTLVYGIVRFKANRLMVTVPNIGNTPVALQAFDLLDGNKGLYIENSFKAVTSKEVLDDTVQQLNIPGMPQLGGIKQVLRRNNRNVKVTVLNNYQLILKPSL